MHIAWSNWVNWGLADVQTGVIGPNSAVGQGELRSTLVEPKPAVAVASMTVLALAHVLYAGHL